MNYIMLVGKFFSIGASFANELPEPQPLLLLCALTVAGLCLAFLFPTKEQLDALDGDKKAADERLDLEISKKLF